MKKALVYAIFGVLLLTPLVALGGGAWWGYGYIKGQGKPPAEPVLIGVED